MEEFIVQQLSKSEQLSVGVGLDWLTMAPAPVVHNVAAFVSVRRRAQMTKEECLAVNAMQWNGPL